MPSGFILQPSYRVQGGTPVVRLYGRLENGDAFLVEDDRFRPYFFVPAHGAKAVAERPGVAVEASELRDLHGGAVARVEVEVPADVRPLRERLERDGVRTFEADIRFPYRFLIDHGLGAAVEIEGAAEKVRPGFVRFRNPDLQPGSWRPRLRVLSIDIETSPDASEVFSIALVGDGADEVHLVAPGDVAGAVVHLDEAALLTATAGRLREIDPDVIVGWNVVDFDLRTLSRRCEVLGVPWQVGRSSGSVTFQQDPGFTRQSRAAIPGRMVLDGIPLVRDAVRLVDYRLETAAQSILGRGKLLDADAPDSAAEIQRLYREDPVALVAYNREDARLVLDILAHEGLIDLAIERSLLCGMQLDRVGASIASFDMLYLPELRRRGMVAPSVDRERKTERVRGGAVLESTPGLFRDVAVYDFKSLYPSLIRTFHLDPTAHAHAGKDALVAPNGGRFSRGDAILPEILERFVERRDAARQRGDRHADQAIKIMMNALFGVLGAASCRFFDPEIANAITGFGQQTLHWTVEAFEAEGRRVLYGDTDSVFVELGTDAGSEAARALAVELRARVEQRVCERVRNAYDVEPRLKLELERVFDRFFLPRVRGGKSGSKKRYAGSTDGTLEIVGLESVRRDWPRIAARLQEGMLERLFADRDVVPFVKELVARVLAGELDGELVYAKRVRKGSLERYTATTPPHVQAARKAGSTGSGVVRYLITRGGPEPVLPGRPLPDDIDRIHYVDKVLRPVADAILSQLEMRFDDAVDRPRQLTLL